MKTPELYAVTHRNYHRSQYLGWTLIKLKDTCLLFMLVEFAVLYKDFEFAII